MATKARTISFRAVGSKESLAHMSKHRPDLHEATKHPTSKYFLGVNLCRIRRDKGWSQGLLAKKAKVSLRTIAYIESADPQCNPGLDIIDSIALALDVSVAKLLERRAADILEI